MGILSYKGYSGSAEYSPEDEVFHGKLLGIRALVSYEADTAKGLRQAFEEAVDDYLETCEAEGLTPETPYRGVFNVRTSSATHRRLAGYAEARGMKLNTLVNEALEAYLREHQAP
jgi:predicted HicB family RNase H-like nuclease